MKISNPRRVLVVGSKDSGLLDLVQGLTGKLPSLNNGAFAGTTQIWVVKTAYYTATIPIWLDEMISPSIWSTEFLAPEAREVLQSLGAFILCFKKPANEADFENIRNSLKCLGKVVREGFGSMWDGLCLAVAMPQTVTPQFERSFDEWEDLCQESEFEFIDFGMKGRNQFSELLGFERLKEVLESNDWESHPQLGEPTFNDEELDEACSSTLSKFQMETAQIKKEFQEMSVVLHEEQITHEIDTETPNDYEEIEKLQAMISKVHMVRDTSAHLPETERRRIAAKVVGEVMKIL